MKYSLKVNEQIDAPAVMVIDHDKRVHRSVKTADAIKMAKNLGLDLIEVNSDLKPPACKIVDLEEYFARRPRK